MKNAVATFETGLASGDLWMCTGAGSNRAPVEEWQSIIGPGELSVLTRSPGPVIDVGCGPGRLAGWLADRGVDSWGVDVSPKAVDMTAERGATAVLGDIFDLDLRKDFRTALLMDGNIGIGGDPAALLERLSELLVPAGRVVCELAAPETASTSTWMVLRSGDEVSDPFPWAVVSASDIEELAIRTGLRMTESWTTSSPGGATRYFATLEKA